MKIGIIGGGISGNVAAWRLNREHDITLYEANDYLGGHTHTHDIEVEGRQVAIDSGFIVFNDWTYPEFVAMLDELGVASRPTEMSFSVRCERTGLEYNGTRIDTLFSQRRNLVRPGFYRMLLDILKFNRTAPTLVEDASGETTLGAFLEAGGYSRAFVEHYVVPMGAAIWSTDPARMLDFPARFFVQFLKNHGLLSINDRPVWRVVEGGSRSYLDAMSASYRDRIRLDSPVASVRRQGGKVLVRTADGHTDVFDHVFIACHSDQALAMLEDPSDAEREVLGALPYQRNEAVLHTDISMMPKSRRAWAAWNYHVPREATGTVGVTYNMNILQRLDVTEQFMVTLNHTHAIDRSRIIATMSYDHPLFTIEGTAAQRRHDELNGERNTWYCGAYWRHGFHEDGVVCALRTLARFREYHETEQLYLRRAG